MSNQLAARLICESKTQIQSEYWITPDHIIDVEDGGDHNHEGWVIEYVLDILAKAAGMDDFVEQYGGDTTAFRTLLWDQAGYDDQGNEIDPWDQLENNLRGTHSDQEIEAMVRLVGGGNQDDAREFAINYWKWIRVAFSHVEVPDLRPATLKRTGNGLLEILFGENGDSNDDDYEAEVVISTFRGEAHRVTINDLLDGRLQPNPAQHDTLAQAGRRAANQLDRQATHPFYNRLGDSLGWPAILADISKVLQD